MKCIDNARRSKSTALRREIKIVLHIAMACAGVFGTTALADTSNPPPVDLDPVEVRPPEYTTKPDLDPYYPPSAGGGGSGVGGSASYPSCAVLRVTKPASCPNKVAYPAGPYYNEANIPNSSIFHLSTLKMAIAYSRGSVIVDGVAVAPYGVAKGQMSNALSLFNNLLANPANTYKNSVSTFRNRLSYVCGLETKNSNTYRIAGVLTRPERYCFNIMRALDAEADDSQNFWTWFANLGKTYGIDIVSLLKEPYNQIASTVIASASMENSLGVQYRTAQAQAQCSVWWGYVEAQKCTF